TNKEILQAREDLMEAIQAFLKEFDHILPEEKCMALLLAEERFFKIKQVMEEEQNQPEVMQELLLKLMNDLQVLKGIQQEKEKPAVQSFTPYGNFSMIDDVEVLMKYVYTFLRKFSRIPFGVTPKVILIAWERFGKIKYALMEKQYRQEDIQELMSKLLKDIPSTFDAFERSVLRFIRFQRLMVLSSDDDDFKDVKYVSLEEVNDVDQEEKEFDLEYIHQIQDVILREKLLNVHRLIVNIESLKDKPTLDHVFNSPFSFPIPVTDSDSFFEESDTFLYYSDNSLPEFKPFSDDTEKTRSGSTTTYANNSLPEYDSFLFEIEPDLGELTNVVIEEDCPDFEDSRVHGFVHSYIRASYPQLHLGNLIS
ncbi:hypothetical protein Tco_0828391, partial [Tanacetum coccineum]